MAGEELKKNMVTLRSSDGEDFVVEQKVAEQSKTIGNLIDDCGTDDPILLPNVNRAVLAKVLDYCQKHADLANEEEYLKEWDAKFMKVGDKIDVNMLYDLLLAANYLNIKGLLDLACDTTANLIKGKTPEEIRATFNIKNDFTPDEEEEIRRENPWAFE